MINVTPSSPRVAVIGCGHWGKNLIRNFAELGALAAVCDQDMEKTKEFSSHYGVPGYSPDEVLSHPDIDAVVIATIAPLHESQAEAALNMGKDVYIEKPMALSLEAAKKLAALAKKHNRILMVGHILNYHPAVTAIKERLPALGTLRHIYVNRLALGRFRHHESILWDLATHDVSLILSLVQTMPSSVHAVPQAYLTPDYPAAAFLNLTFPSGLTAHIQTSWISPFKEQKVVVVGDKGIVVFDDQKPWAEKLSLSTECLTWAEGKPEAHSSPCHTYIPLPESEPLKNECMHFLTCIQKREQPLTCGEEGVRVTEVLEKAELSFLSRPESHLS